jgi:membrane protein implicated in regulation of membrane protease activity
MAAPEAVSGLPVDPVWLLLGALFLLGVLVVVAGRRIRRRRTAGQLNF